jgi:hypothetical protein
VSGYHWTYDTQCGACGRLLVRWWRDARGRCGYDTHGADRVGRTGPNEFGLPPDAITMARCADCGTWCDRVGGRPLAPQWTREVEE